MFLTSPLVHCQNTPFILYVPELPPWYSARTPSLDVPELPHLYNACTPLYMFLNSLLGTVPELPLYMFRNSPLGTVPELPLYMFLNSLYACS